MERINASDFKARCLSTLDGVRTTGERVVILKRDQPVAELGPATDAAARYPQMDLEGSVTVVSDLIEPAVPEHHWESNQ